MKKLILIAFVLVMYGCSKKDVKPKPPSIVGLWYITSLTDIDFTVTPHSVYHMSYDYQFKRTDYFQFNSDGTGNVKYDTNLSSFNYTVASNIINVSQTGSPTQQISIKSMTATDLDLFETYTDSHGVTTETVEILFSR